MEDIRRHQHPQSCEEAPFVVGPLPTPSIPIEKSVKAPLIYASGLGSRYTYYRSCLLMALDAGAVWVPHVGGHDDAGNLLKPWSGCTMADVMVRVAREANVTRAQSSILSCSRNLHGSHNVPARYGGWGLLWWQVVSTAYFLRPTAALRRQVEVQKARMGWPAAPGAAPMPLHAPPSAPVAGLHIRRTDKLEGQHFDVDEYVGAAAGRRHVFLATDDSRLVREAAARHPELVWMSVNRTASPASGSHWHQEREAMLQGSSPALEEALVEILLLSDCDVLVGTFSSFFGQLALDLALARTDGFCHATTMLDNAATDRPALFLLPGDEANLSASNCSGGAVRCDCIEVVPQADQERKMMDSADYGMLEMHALGSARLTRYSPRSTSIDTLCTLLSDDGLVQVERLLRVITHLEFNRRLQIINYVADPTWGACHSSASRAQLVPRGAHNLVIPY